MDEVHQLIDDNLQLKQQLTKLEEQYKEVKERESKRSAECETLIVQIGKLNEQLTAALSEISKLTSRMAMMSTGTNEMSESVLKALESIQKGLADLEQQQYQGQRNINAVDGRWIMQNVIGAANFAYAKIEEFVRRIEEDVCMNE